MNNRNSSFIRRNRHCKEQERSQKDFQSQKDQLRCWRRENLPNAFPKNREGRCSQKRSCQKSKALLSPRQSRKGCKGQGTHRQKERLSPGIYRQGSITFVLGLFCLNRFCASEICSFCAVKIKWIFLCNLSCFICFLC